VRDARVRGCESQAQHDARPQLAEIGMFEWIPPFRRYTHMAVATTHSNPETPHPALQDSCFPPAAFQFVVDGLAFTTERAFGQYLGEGLPLPDLRHVTGQQLCLGLREFAIERFGMLAPCVLRHWNISRTEDFGQIVYLLIEAGRLSKSADDSLDDFHGVFDFEEAFSVTALRSQFGARQASR
jgi:uncharacterized repeat protein (TIGR04138 family)